MTLAVILLSASIVVSPAPAAAMPFQASQSGATSQTSGGAITQDQGTQNQASQNQGANQPQNQPAPPHTSKPQTSKHQTSQPQTSQPKTAKPQSSSTQKKSSPASAKKASTASAANPKAKTDAADCKVSAAGNSGAENKNPSTDSAPSTSSPTAQASAPVAAGSAPASTTAPNCPPTKKVIVPEGSTPEPSIQLAGGSADPPARDNAKQLLQSTEDNLKKIEGQQLTSNQRDMVTQIRQFITQSKQATEDGDLESARTLAWKAQTLSQELINPAK
jgi:hypothetical protein